MQILTIAAQKGGVGKTTLAAHLAREALTAGYEQTAMIDLDPQGSLSDWFNVREAEEPYMAEATTQDLSAKLAALRGAGIDMVIIDTPPGHTATITAAIQEADLVLVPVQPSPVDIRAVGPTVEMIEGANKPFAFILNRAVPRTAIASQTTLALAAHGKIAPSPVSQRVDYAAAMTDGRVAQELKPTGPAAKEMAELWAFIEAQLSKGAGVKTMTATGVAA